jgi:protein ImuB
MLWVALCFPHLALDSRLRGRASPEAADQPWAVVESRSVLICNAAAEAEALEAIAVWAGQFTAKVSLEPPRDVLLEVEGSLRLFGGLARLMARLRNGLVDLGFGAILATGPTARAALWLARSEGQSLHAVPVEAIEPAPEALDLLRRIGIRTLGELARLPRAGLAARLGQRLLDDLDRATGALPEPRRFFVPPERFSARLELPAPVTQAERVLFAARRLLVQMEGFLAARQTGVRGFTLSLLHRGASPTRLELRFAAPRRDAEHCLHLLRERLDRSVLAHPADTIRLEADRLAPLAGAPADLFGDPRAGAEAWERLAEHLQARLGEDQVHGLATHAEHRPERAWRATAAAAGAAGAAEAPPGPRPLWLLEPPRRVAEGDFVLLAGPERIESGWWEGEDVVRDYFIAARGASLAWIYRAREGWFLHGLFA